MKKFLLLLLSLPCLYNTSLAQNAGDLDYTYGANVIAIQGSAPWVDIAIQPDGKALAVSNIVARYDVNGILDGTFSIDGIDSLVVDSTLYNGSAVGVQQDGKIVVAGGLSNGFIDSPDFVLIRYNTDGSRDNSFDGDGSLLTDINSGSEDYVYGLAIQQDGKIIVAGSSDGRLALCRYNSDGSLDNTFDGDGKLVYTSFAVNVSADSRHAAYIKLQTNGKILVGTTGFLVRLNPDGSFDTSFANNGLILFPPRAMYDLAIQPDGKIVLAGTVAPADFVVIRLDTNGSFDNNFGNGGIMTTHWDCMACTDPKLYGTSVALQPDGRILVGGYSVYCQLWNCRDFVLIRYNPDGSLDSSFNSNGQVQVYAPDAVESEASVITLDFKLILAGHTAFTSTPWEGYGILARYHLGWLLDVNSIPTANENFIIAPNPTSDWINIEASKMENGIWHLDIRDITGRPVLQEDIVATDGSIKKKVSLNDLSAGLYFVQLDNGKNKMVSRVVKYK